MNGDNAPGIKWLMEYVVSSSSEMTIIEFPARLVQKKIQRDREKFYAAIAAKYPIVRLFKSDWITAGPPEILRLHCDEYSKIGDVDLSLGGWLMTFCSTENETLAVPFHAFPMDSNEALRALAELNCAVAIWSWYDNNEWFVVVRAGAIDLS